MTQASDRQAVLDQIDRDSATKLLVDLVNIGSAPGPDRFGRLAGLGGREFQNIDNVVRVATVFALTALYICSRPAGP